MKTAPISPQKLSLIDELHWIEQDIVKVRRYMKRDVWSTIELKVSHVNNARLKDFSIKMEKYFMEKVLEYLLNDRKRVKQELKECQS